MKTIAAISTPPGNGGIGIIRISGEDALRIINKIFVPKKAGELTPFVLKLGNIIDDNNEKLDQVLVSYFKAPKSYTGEDVVEISCHGGNIILKNILDIVLKNGAFLAEAGEFTKKAFLNGKMDLTQAEAVMDLINSKSEKEERASAKQLEGRVGQEIRRIKDNIINMLADIEANIDYPEYEDIEEVQNEKISKILEEQVTSLKMLEQSFKNGKILKNGISTAIIGKPNVGKSSLLNILLDEERAIVTEIPGTTRDTIEEYITINGITLKLIDTAGIRSTEDLVENIGVEKSKKAITDAELVLFILDGSCGYSNEEKLLYEQIKDKQHIVVINKIDLNCEKIDIKNENVIRISTKTREGLEELEKRIEKLFDLNNIDTENSLIITNIRHKDLITKAIQNIEKAKEAVENKVPVDMVSINIQEAINSLGEILGESISENVLNKIFEKFCVGK